jgi:hypothetical protein
LPGRERIRANAGEVELLVGIPHARLVYRINMASP